MSGKQLHVQAPPSCLLLGILALALPKMIVTSLTKYKQARAFFPPSRMDTARNFSNNLKKTNAHDFDGPLINFHQAKSLGGDTLFF